MKRYALVTGASGGIGASVAKTLAAKGYSLYLHYHTNEETVKELYKKLQTEYTEIYMVQADLSEEKGADLLWEQIHHELEAIVYTAGKSVFGLVTDTSEEQLRSMMTLHLTNLYRIGNKALPTMIRNRAGSIVVISSIWGQTGASCEVLYSMVKGGQNTYVKALAKEVALSGVRVNAVAPGAVETDMLSIFSEEERKEIAQDIPMGRLAYADEIADTVSFLLSKQSSYITGQVLGVNGGWHC
ncbi:SDR family oxidoreductase [Bacillus sp. 165]|uniref:elongation factor P 5-aminopentanone reductase n=1 Tax=Bacillus sp. 165 TaxID=1529117 RepID=UPI001ADAE90C|nr:SDR family oxidoreductase [Bacillus sp. 165]MBO9128890.1 SDR family oxidoreductase [Bacillus sp. 165]